MTEIIRPSDCRLGEVILPYKLCTTKLKFGPKKKKKKLYDFEIDSNQTQISEFMPQI